MARSGVPPVQARSLSDIAESNLLSMADLAFLSQVPVSTLSRLWQDESWLDRVSGPTLQLLLGALPGLAEHLARRGCAARLEGAVRKCRDAGLELRPGAMARFLADVRLIPHLATALSAAAGVARLDPREATAYLARCWGSRQDLALDAAFSAGPDRLLADPAGLLAQARDLVGRVEVGNNALHPTVAYGILVHKIAKATGAPPVLHRPDTPERHSAFAYRSGVIGVLLHTDDLETSIAYQRALERNPLLRRNELWSLSSYCADIQQTPQFTVTMTRGLRRTAGEVIRDVGLRNETYLHYLVNTAIPVLLERDPGFGGQQAELRRSLHERLTAGISAPIVRTAAAQLIRKTR